jgi:hypothetical protein
MLSLHLTLFTLFECGQLTMDSEQASTRIHSTLLLSATQPISISIRMNLKQAQINSNNLKNTKMNMLIKHQRTGFVQSMIKEV